MKSCLSVAMLSILLMSIAYAEDGKALVEEIKARGELSEDESRVVAVAAELNADFLNGAARKALGMGSRSDFVALATQAQLDAYRKDVVKRAELQGIASGVVPTQPQILERLKPALSQLAIANIPDIAVPDALRQEVNRALLYKELIYKPLCSSGLRLRNERGRIDCIEGDPWSASLFQSVVPILVDGKATCTGTVLENGVVLTAAHCLLETVNSSDHVMKSTRISVQGLKGVVLSLVAEPLVPSERMGDCLPDCGDPEYDFAVLKLDPAASATLKPIPSLALLSAKRNVPITIAGYGRTTFPIEVSEGDFFIGSQTLRLVDPNQPFEWGYSLGTNETGSTNCGGDSGGPIFLGKPRRDKDSLTLIGIISSFVGDKGECFKNSRASSVNLSQAGPRSRLCSYLGATHPFCMK
ncbi:hypothetical protein PsexTeo8_19330 [Pseudomonas extremaustralis]|uniref:trypsin-like serine protease n=1 Tax=Pseudomonas extremaustralis TaxID=359110 RepID=UPI002AA0CB23|nr:trypsin-like serine protease [Pseudomonas extremaustralis]MDY7065497.1 hypothetical protein [Pseudomonas extremaustralis]